MINIFGVNPLMQAHRGLTARACRREPPLSHRKSCFHTTSVRNLPN